MNYSFSQYGEVSPASGIVALDTSLVYELWGNPSSPVRQALCGDFTRDVVRHNGIMVVPVQVCVELRFIVEDDILGPKGIRKAELNEAPVLARQVTKRVAEIEEALFSGNGVYPEPVGIIDGGVLRRADQIVEACAAEHGDAIIVALMEQNQIPAIATLDGDFAKVAMEVGGIDLFVPPYTLKKLSKVAAQLSVGSKSGNASK